MSSRRYVKKVDVVQQQVLEEVALSESTEEIVNAAFHQINTACLTYDNSDELAAFLSQIEMARLVFCTLLEKVKFMEEYISDTSGG